MVNTFDLTIITESFWIELSILQTFPPRNTNFYWREATGVNLVREGDTLFWYVWV